MTGNQIIRMRLGNQLLAKPGKATPQSVVASMVAMQAQEFAMSKWAIGLRSASADEKKIEKAFNEGNILRTHVLRPTWHFVAPADIRWMLELTAPRVHQANAFMYRQSELTPKLFTKTTDIIAAALEGNRHLTRDELNDIFKQHRIKAEGFRLGYLMMHAELEGVICSGPRKGNQFTYALISERVPAIKPVSKEEGLHELAMRYFETRGPATAADFVWWSGLSAADVKKAIASLSSTFKKVEADGKEYFYKAGMQPAEPVTFLMGDYDEYGISYKDRSAILYKYKGDLAAYKRGGNPIFNRMIVVDGVIAGSWKPSANKKSVETHLFRKLNKAEQAALKKAVDRFTAFS